MIVGRGIAFCGPMDVKEAWTLLGSPTDNIECFYLKDDWLFIILLQIISNRIKNKHYFSVRPIIIILHYSNSDFMI